PEMAWQMLDGWMKAQPSRIEGRRQMPFFELTEEETKALAEFLRFADQTDTQAWPPNDAG
ncbi:nitric oxide reductase subunit C, partial [Tranquillimonas alkanivorans]